MVNRVFVSLGSNIDKEKNLPAAVRIMCNLCRVVAVSGVYETAPVGLVEQPSFLNAAVIVETELDAHRFRREVLDEVERRLGRVRTEDKNAPRTIDADMVLFNEKIFDLDPEHHIPDPDLLAYPHVAVPLADLDPDFQHPETGERLSLIASRLASKLEQEGVQIFKERSDIELQLAGSPE